MGRVYSKLGDYNKAIELNDKATSIFKAIGDSTSVAGCYNERGVMHHFMNEFTVAERFFQRALAINRAQRKSERDCNQPEQPLSVPGKYGRETFFHPGTITINKNLDAQWSLGENYNNMGKQYYYDKQYSKPWKPCIKPTSMPTTSEPAN